MDPKFVILNHKLPVRMICQTTISCMPNFGCLIKWTAIKTVLEIIATFESKTNNHVILKNAHENKKTGKKGTLNTYRNIWRIT